MALVTGKTWWLWRLAPHPAKKLAVDIEVPWSYLASEPVLTQAEGSATLQYLERRVVNLVNFPIVPWRMMENPIGGMRTLILKPWIATRRNLWLTPPLHRFCDLSKHKGKFESNVPHDTFLVQPEVYAATGEFLEISEWNVGRRPDDLMVIRVDDLRDSPFPEAAGFVQVALDSYLERGEADPRFNPAGGSAPPLPRRQSLIQEIRAGAWRKEPK